MDSARVVAVWNRAAMGNTPAQPARGDAALAMLLRAHGLVMNGGVLHAAEVMEEQDFRGAIAGYLFFGLTSVANLLARARALPRGPADLGMQEALLDSEYHDLVPDDSFLFAILEGHLNAHPEEFSAV